MTVNKLLIKIESKLPQPFKDELADKGWLTLLAEASALVGLVVAGYVALVVTCIYVGS